MYPNQVRKGPPSALPNMWTPPFMIENLKIIFINISKITCTPSRMRYSKLVQRNNFVKEKQNDHQSMCTKCYNKWSDMNFSINMKAKKKLKNKSKKLIELYESKNKILSKTKKSMAEGMRDSIHPIAV